jgi:hypothetical protein
MMSLCRCFARRVKFDEIAAKTIRRIRTAFAIQISLSTKPVPNFPAWAYDLRGGVVMRLFCPTDQLLIS